MPRRGARDLARDGMLAGAIGLGALALYGVTACRTIFTGDSPELAAAAACFGVPHPPGYPLYTFLTALWVHLFPLADRALAANLASSIHGAAAVALTFLLARRMGLSRLAGALAAAVLALSRTFWAQSVAGEVYAFDLLLFLLCVHAVWSAVERASSRASFVAGLAAGLWLGHRFINVAYLPALLLLARAARPPAAPAKRRPRAALAPLAAGLVTSLLPFLYLPLASARDPVIDIGDPETPARFWTVVRGAPYLRHLAGTTPALALGRLGSFAAALPVESGLGAALALVGIVTFLRRASRGRQLAWAWLLLLVSNQALAMLYNVMDIRSYQVPSLLALAMLGGLGAEAARRAAVRAGRARSHALAMGLVVIAAAWGLAANGRANDLHLHRAAYQRAEDLLASVAPDALLLVKGDTETHSVWYLHCIERKAPGVLVVSLGHASAWYFDALRARHPQDPIPAYGEGASPAPYYLRLLETVGRVRPVFFAFDPGELARLTPGAWWGERAIVPTGLALEASVRDAGYDPNALAARCRALWGEMLPRIPRTEPWPDFETRMIGLEYALALQRSGEFLERQGERAAAGDLFRAVQALRPARWERDLVKEYATIGRRVPALDLEERAARALRDLDAR